MKSGMNTGKKYLFAMLVIVMAIGAVAIAYASMTPAPATAKTHDLLYANSIQSKAGTGIINVPNDGLSVINPAALGIGVSGKGAKTGVYGEETGSGSSNSGVHGKATQSGTPNFPTYGVYGEASLTAADSYGVRGEAKGPNGYGVSGRGEHLGVIGAASLTDSDTAIIRPTTPTGVYGIGFGDGSYGVYGYTNEINSYGVYGETTGSNSHGVYGKGSNNGASSGVYGEGYTGVNATGYKYGVYAVATGVGLSYGVQASGDACDFNAAVNGVTDYCGSETDIAEYFLASGSLEPGDVVVIDTSNKETIKKSTKAYDTLAAGVVSTSPSVALGYKDDNSGSQPLALSGRVPVKASAENGAIKIGDLLTTSDTAGYAMKCDDRAKCSGAIIGKALEPLAGGKGKVSVLVTLG